MRRPFCARLAVEPLEDRCCPSVTAQVLDGNLVITGSSPGLVITEETMGVGTGVFKVLDNGVSRGLFTVSGDVRVWLGGGADAVGIDLKGNVTPGSLYLNLGGGGDRLAVRNGGVGGHLLALGGPGGTDRVTLGDADGGTALAVAGNTFVAADGLGNDQLTVNASVRLQALTTLYVNTVFVANGSTVNANLTAVGGPGSTSFTLGGTVGGGLGFLGSPAADTVGVQNTAVVAGNVFVSTAGGKDVIALDGTFNGSVAVDAGAGDDTVGLGGTVSGLVVAALGDGNDTFVFTGATGINTPSGVTLAVDAGAGDDTVTLAAGSTSTGSTLIWLGLGSDRLNLAGLVGPGDGNTFLYVDAGPGNDSVALQPTAGVFGTALVRLGDGRDGFALKAGVSFVSLTVDGDAGDTFYNNTGSPVLGNVSAPNLAVTTLAAPF